MFKFFLKSIKKEKCAERDLETFITIMLFTSFKVNNWKKTNGFNWIPKEETSSEWQHASDVDVEWTY